MKPAEIIQSIIDDKNEYYGYSHFHSSNMADYTLMSETINELSDLYEIDPFQAAEIVQALTHS